VTVCDRDMSEPVTVCDRKMSEPVTACDRDKDRSINIDLHLDLLIPNINLSFINKLTTIIIYLHSLISSNKY